MNEDRPFDICERAFRFALDIVEMCKRLDEKRSNVAWTLSKQVLRSGTSIGANLEEGQAGQSKADFISKYSIARKEVRESRYWLRLLQRSGFLTVEQASGLLNETDEMLRILTAIIKKTKGDDLT